MERLTLLLLLTLLALGGAQDAPVIQTTSGAIRGSYKQATSGGARIHIIVDMHTLASCIFITKF